MNGVCTTHTHTYSYVYMIICIYIIVHISIYLAYTNVYMSPFGEISGPAIPEATDLTLHPHMQSRWGFAQ